MKSSRYLVLAVITAALLARAGFMVSMDRLLPLNGLYVDEVTFFGSPFVHGVEGFSRPPGMFVLAMALGILGNPLAARAVMSLISLIPALILYLALGRRNIWGGIVSAAMAFSPFLILFGTQLMPAVPAAVLVSLSIAAAVRERYCLSGLMIGAAALMRAEFLLVPVFLLALSLGRHMRKWLGFTAAAAAAVLPVILVNLISGAGPVIGANGGENLWIGTEWDMISTPPGVEFEELVSIGNLPGTGDGIFAGRAWESISSNPLRWFGMGVSKTLAFLSLPGPGRNFETGWVIGETFLLFLLLLTLPAMSTGIACAFRSGPEYWKLLASSVLLTGLATAFIFFPSARFRTAVLPSVWFLAAGCGPPSRRVLSAIAAVAAGIVLVSALMTYPGTERSGLTSILASEHELGQGNLYASFEYLDDGVRRGYQGADLHNIRGALLSLSDRRAEGLLEFEKALEISPGSPTLWKNYAVSLWANGLYSRSLDAARRAVYLNPLLREELGPILEREEVLR